MTRKIATAIITLLAAVPLLVDVEPRFRVGGQDALGQPAAQGVGGIPKAWNRPEYHDALVAAYEVRLKETAEAGFSTVLLSAMDSPVHEQLTRALLESVADDAQGHHHSRTGGSRTPTRRAGLRVALPARRPPAPPRATRAWRCFLGGSGGGTRR